MADCPGHVVPGAFMSMIGNTMLNELSSKGISSPGVLLDELNINIITALRQNKDASSTDGMDIILLIKDKETNEVKIACANHRVILIDEEIKSISGNYFSIGEPRVLKKKLKYEETTINKCTNKTQLYFFSDGYTDQFGGENNEKFGSKRFMELISQIHKESPEIQKTKLASTLEKWTNQIKVKQIDDIIVSGIEL